MLNRELYYITDGQGRHLAAGENDGSIAGDIVNGATQYDGWQATGAAGGAAYGADRLTRPQAPGLAFYRNRLYDQSTGRWTQEDPLGVAGGINLYQFDGINPVAYSDPFGLCPPCGEEAATHLALKYVTWAYGHSKSAQTAGAIGDFVRNYSAMREANTIGADKYFHAKANCEAAQRGATGSKMAQAISDAREWTDQHIKGDPKEASAADQVANHEGRAAGTANSKGSCSEMVKKFRPNGLSQEY